MKKKLVIARYREDVDWVKQLAIPYVVYQKDKDMINRGREASTFLHHIIHHYDCLDDITFFVQGDPFAHCDQKVFFSLQQVQPKKAIGICTRWPKNLQHLSSRFSKYQGLQLMYSEENSSYLRWETVHMNCFWEYFFSTPFKLPIVFVPGAQWIVPRECIVRYPLFFWKELYEMSMRIKVFPWVIERFWNLIFNDATLKIKDRFSKKQFCFLRLHSCYFVMKEYLELWRQRWIKYV